MSQTSSSEQEKLDFIDALRGIAILMVIAFHVGLDLSESGIPVTGLFKGGQYGVQLFFVASAFTLCLSHFRRRREPCPHARFFVRRFFRIAPMYYLGLLCYGLIRGLHSGIWPPEGYGPAGVLTNLTFTHGFSPAHINYVVPGGWSIACEMLFYGFFPVLMMWVTTWRRALVLVIATTLLNQVSAWLSFQPLFQQTRETEPLFFYFWLPNQCPVFAFGILTYFGWHHATKCSPGVQQRIALAAWTGFASLALIAAALLFRKTLGPHSHSIMPLLCGISFGLLLLALSLRPTVLLVNRVTTTFGFHSFGIYLAHFAFLWLWMTWQDALPLRHLPAAAQWGTGFALISIVTLLAAVGLHYLIEQPGMNLGRQVIRIFFSPGQPVQQRSDR